MQPTWMHTTLAFLQIGPAWSTAVASRTHLSGNVPIIRATQDAVDNHLRPLVTQFLVDSDFKEKMERMGFEFPRPPPSAFCLLVPIDLGIDTAGILFSQE